MTSSLVFCVPQSLFEAFRWNLGCIFESLVCKTGKFAPKEKAVSKQLFKTCLTVAVALFVGTAAYAQDEGEILDTLEKSKAK